MEHIGIFTEEMNKLEGRMKDTLARQDKEFKAAIGSGGFTDKKDLELRERHEAEREQIRQQIAELKKRRDQYETTQRNGEPFMTPLVDIKHPNDERTPEQREENIKSLQDKLNDIFNRKHKKGLRLK